MIKNLMNKGEERSSSNEDLNELSDILPKEI
jgi:hypothetical protein